MTIRTFAVALCLGLSIQVCAEIVSVGDHHYHLRHEATSEQAPDALWERLIRPSSWWHPDHTYSGSAGNLSLIPEAGGLWREDWPGGSVEHGRVLLAQKGKMLRMNAPFGPLQGAGAHVIWTITISAREGGSKVVFEERALAASGAGLDQLAPAVDGVKQQAIERLTQSKIEP